MKLDNINEKRFENFCKLVSSLNNLSADKIITLLNSSFSYELDCLIKKHLTPKSGLPDQNKLIDDYWKLSFENRIKILKDILFWSDQKIKELNEDFGYGISPIILRHLKEKCLLYDFREELDRYLIL